jgi:1-acyl-sn-glycerol-3-phosphate acyltransferase
VRRLVGSFRLLVATLLTVGVAVTAIVGNLLDQRRGRVFFWLARRWSRGVLAICGLRLSVKGQDLLEHSTNYVYVSNHASLFDIPVVTAAVPDNIRIVYKKELEKIPIFGWNLKWGPYIAIDRGRRADALRSVEEAARKIREGDSVLLFAEGTRTEDGRLQPFKRGAFNLAVRSGVPVVPVTINGTFRIMAKGSVAIHPGPIEVIFNAPLPVHSQGGRDEEVRVMEEVHRAIAENYRDQ